MKHKECLLVLLATVVLTSCGQRTRKVVTFNHESNANVMVSCSDKRACEETIWCLENSNRVFYKFRDVWSEMVVRLPQTEDVPYFLIGESNDSSFRGLRDSQNGLSVAKKLEELEEDQSPGLWSRFFFGREVAVGEAELRFSVYGESCFKLARSGTTKNHAGHVDIHIEKSVLAVRYPVMLILGLILLELAPILSSQVLFYYSIGVSLGVLLSVLITTYFVLKTVAPNRKVTVWMAVGFQSMFFTALAYFSNLVEELAQEYFEYVFLYFVGSALLSFFLTHWMLKGSSESDSGPSSSVKDIVRWIIQLAGLALILHSSPSVRWALTITACVFGSRILLPWVRSLLSILVGAIHSLFCYIFCCCRKRHGNPPKRYTKWVGESGKPKTGGEGHMFLDEDEPAPALEYTYLASPLRTKREFRVEGKVHTRSELQKLENNPEFAKWVMRNRSRIRVLPRELDDDDDDEAEESE